MSGLWVGEGRRVWLLSGCMIAIVAGLLTAHVAQAQPGTTERVSLSSSGEEGNGSSCYASISTDGRFVAFGCWASNLVPGDTNGRKDVFVRDRVLGRTERVSLSSSGEEGNGNSGAPAIGADGRYVAFFSLATNLVPGDTNGYLDVFVRDRELGTTERVSLSSSGEEGNDDSEHPCISADGRYVAFDSLASNLVPGDTNGDRDIFVRDRLTGTTERVSISCSGEEGNDDSGDDYGSSPSISADGRYVAFDSWASNLVPGDTNESRDAFVRDRELGTTERVSLSSSGEQGNGDSGGGHAPSISADGRYVAFWSQASNLVPGDTKVFRDVFVRDRQLGTTERVSLSSSGEQGTGISQAPSISVDGRFVAFHSSAGDLVPGDTNRWNDVFVRDRQLGTTDRVSLSSSGEQGNYPSWDPSISEDGLFVAYNSGASNLVPGDTNNARDVFVRGNLHYYGVSGAVTFAQLLPSASAPSSVQLLVMWNGESLGTLDMELGADGSYSLLLPSGSLELSIKHTHWLRRTVQVDTTFGPVTGADFLLLNGDATDDNAVGPLDLDQVLTLFGTSDPMTDLDEGGTVDLPDLNIVLVNFGKAGDP